MEMTKPLMTQPKPTLVKMKTAKMILAQQPSPEVLI
jgi:hypothetical protein